MIRFAREPISPDLVCEIMPLAKAHFSEVDPFTDKPQNLDVTIYNQASEFLRIFTAREKAADPFTKNLVGYAVFVVTKHPHYIDSLQAQQDLLYLSPKSRGAHGMDFMRFCDKALEKEGVEVIYNFSPLKRDIGPILKRLGYEQIQTLWARRVA